MSIYDKKTEFDFLGATKQFIPFIAAIIALVLLFLIFTFLSEITKPQAIVASFSENPLELTKNSFTTLTVKITNITGGNAQPVPFEVRAEDSASIKITCEKSDLGFIEKGNERITTCLVRPTNSVSGTYTLNISVVMNAKPFRNQVKLEVKTK